MVVAGLGMRSPRIRGRFRYTILMHVRSRCGRLRTSQSMPTIRSANLQSSIKISFPRRTVAIIATVGAFAAIGIGSASAHQTMPAANPTDYGSLNRTATAQVFNVTIKGSQLEGNAFTKTVSNGLMGGMGAIVTVKQATAPGFSAYQTITVAPTKVGQVTSSIKIAYATLSGATSDRA